jgi:hypothetical protein
MNFYTNLTEVLTRVLRGADAEEMFNSIPVQVRTSDGYINLSAIATANGTDTAQYFRNKRVIKFLDDLKHALKGEKSRNSGEKLANCAQSTESQNSTEKLGMHENKELELVIRSTNSNGRVVWAHPLVILDFAGWISTAMQIQIHAWIARVLTTGSVALAEHTDVSNVTTLLKTQLEETQKELTRALVERDELANIANRLRLRRQRPLLPSGSGVYVCMTEATPEISKIGIFDGSMNERMRGYHTHSSTPVLVKAILFTNNFKHIEATILEALMSHRKNSNEWVSLSYKHIVKLLQIQLNFQKSCGETAAYMLDETSEELIKFNESSLNISGEDLECVTTTITTSTNIDGSVVTTASTTGLKWLEHKEVTCDCGETFETLRGHHIHVTKSKNPLCRHVSKDIVKQRQLESNRKRRNAIQLTTIGGVSISCPVCGLEMVDTNIGLANHLRLGPPECQEYGRKTSEERKAKAYNKGLQVSRQQRNSKRIAECGSIFCPAECGTEIANNAYSIGLHLRYSKDPKCIEYNERTKGARRREAVRISNQKCRSKHAPGI